MKILIILFLSFMSVGVHSASHNENEEIPSGSRTRLLAGRGEEGEFPFLGIISNEDQDDKTRVEILTRKLEEERKEGEEIREAYQTHVHQLTSQLSQALEELAQTKRQLVEASIYRSLYEVESQRYKRLTEQAEETGTSRPSSTTSKSSGSTFSFVSHSSHEEGENEDHVELESAPVLEPNSTEVHSPAHPDEDL